MFDRVINTPLSFLKFFYEKSVPVIANTVNYSRCKSTDSFSAEFPQNFHNRKLVDICRQFLSPRETTDDELILCKMIDWPKFLTLFLTL